MCISRKMLAIASAVLLASCGDGEPHANGDATKPSQVAARVNGAELTVHQINYILQRMPNFNEKDSKAASRVALTGLVEQELLMQKAVAEKLDRDPTVLQAIDGARRQILAEAWMSRKLGTPVEPTDAEISDFFNGHPELFGNRKLYRLQEISIKAPADKLDTIRARLAAAKTLDDFAAWLKAENLPARAAQVVKAAEQLPRDLVSKLAQVPKGQAIVAPTPDGVLVILVADVQPQPVTLGQAKPAIARLLQQQARERAAKAELDGLKAAAKIEYVGEFAEAGEKSAASMREKPVAGAGPAVQESTEAMSKGIAGLK